MLHTTVVHERPVRRDTDSHINEAFLPRFNSAASAEHPNGTPGWPEDHKSYSVLQQHVLFWDRDRDNVIWPHDTYKGFRDLGFNIIFSFIATVIINLSFSIPTRLGHTLIPDPYFRIYVDTIHKAKHGSDSSVYDTEGRFVPARFEDIFTKYAKTSSDSLSIYEIWTLTKGNRVVFDPFGWFAAISEWGAVVLLCQKDGRISKEDVRRVYDGSLFFSVRDARMTEKGWNKGWGLGGDGMIGGEKILSFGL